MGFQFLHKALHPRALKLEDTVSLSRPDVVQYLCIVIINLLHINRRIFLSRHPDSVLDHSQGTQPQEIHLQQTQLFQSRHGKLCSDRTVRGPGKRHIFIHRFLADDHARRMHGTVSRKPFQTFRHIDEVLHLLVIFIGLPQLRIFLQGLVDRYIQFLGDHFGNAVYKCIRQVHNPSHIPDDAPGGKRSERNDLDDTVFPVLPYDIIDHFLPALKAEIHVDIRHGHTFRIEEPLKQKLITDRIDGGNAQTVRNNASCR